MPSLLRTPSIALGWSLATGASLIGAAVYLTTEVSQSLAYSGYLVGAIGIGIILIGCCVETLSPPSIRPLDDERSLFRTKPTERTPLVKSAGGTTLAVAGLIGLFWTTVPIAYPALGFLLGVTFYGVGLVQLWRNNLTRYHVTDQRVIEVYQLLGVKRRTMPRDRIQGIEENQRFLERLIGVGHVRVESAGDTNTSQLTARNITCPRQFANYVRT